MVEFRRPEHRAIAAALHAMDHDLLTDSKCWFGGGTEIVLDLGEYRLSRDVDFLCADADGYREMRTRAVSQGVRGFFAAEIQERRAFKVDQYGIRGIVSAGDIDIKVEIIRKGRIDLDGQPDSALGVPRLILADRVAEKLLANADRCQDRSTAYRDAVDLGMLALHRGPFPPIALAKAERAYGDDVGRKLVWVLERLSHPDERNRAASVLGMDLGLLEAAARTLAEELLHIRPRWFGAASGIVPRDPIT